MKTTQTTNAKQLLVTRLCCVVLLPVLFFVLLPPHPPTSHPHGIRLILHPILPTQSIDQSTISISISFLLFLPHKQQEQQQDRLAPCLCVWLRHNLCEDDVEHTYSCTIPILWSTTRVLHTSTREGTKHTKRTTWKIGNIKDEQQQQ